jgi:GMP synthase (glutamine-hydrolysing)
MPEIAIIKLGSIVQSLREKFGDYDKLIPSYLNINTNILKIYRVNEGDILPEPDKIAGVILSGSSSMITQHNEYTERTAKWIPEIIKNKIPLLGICYGHQLVAYAMGGIVDNNPTGREIGTVEVIFNKKTKSDKFFKSFYPKILIQASHLQSVLKLPEEATLMGSTEQDPNHVFSIGSSTWCVQFHPEFDVFFIRALIKRRAKLYPDEFDEHKILSATQDTPAGPEILKRFIDIVLHRIGI